MLLSGNHRSICGKNIEPIVEEQQAVPNRWNASSIPLQTYTCILASRYNIALAFQFFAAYNHAVTIECRSTDRIPYHAVPFRPIANTLTLPASKQMPGPNAAGGTRKKRAGDPGPEVCPPPRRYMPWIVTPRGRNRSDPGPSSRKKK